MSEKTQCHCGLDPQSPDKQECHLRRFRVKHGMTDF